jgi:O-antigen ligase
MLFEINPWIRAVYLVTTAILFVCALVIVIRTRRIPGTFVAGLLFLAACALAGIFNPETINRTVGLLISYVGALSIMVIAERFGENDLLVSLEIAVWIFLGLFLIDHSWDAILGDWQSFLRLQHNVISIWPAMAIPLLLARRRPWYAFMPFVAMLLLYFSRGALLGVAIAVIVLLRPKLSLRQWVFLFVVAFLIGILMFLVSPDTALDRPLMWQRSLSQMIEENILFGLGGGGILSKQVLVEPGGFIQPHAHNMFVHYVAEYGLIGFVGIILAAVWIIRLKPKPGWAIALWAGILVHGLFDHPLSFAGPLLIYSAVAGVIQFSSGPGFVSRNENALDQESLVEGRASSVISTV